jgi:SAM-dependent methyltransferase
MKSWSAYDDSASDYFDSYEKLEFSTVHRAFLRFLPPKGSRCLDVGAGSGRDAAALAKRGYLVTAVEPSSKLLFLAKTHHAGLGIRWVSDSLPVLSAVKSFGEKFDFVLISAVWMHLQQEDWIPALQSLRSVLRGDGKIAVTLRYGGDNASRGMHSVDIAKLIQCAANQGLVPVYQSRRNADQLGRAVEWRKVVFSTMPPKFLA